MSEAYDDPEVMEEEGAERAAVDIATFIGLQNIAEQLDDNTLHAIGEKACEEFKQDFSTLEAAGWIKKIDAAMKAATQVAEAKNYPWPNASNVKYPLITTAAIQFNARAMPAIIDGPEIVKGKILGQPSEEKAARADRIGKHMSWQLLDEMEEWEEETDKLLIYLPVVGSAFRKSRFDPLLGYNCSELVMADKFVVSNMTKNLKTCPRGTHILEFYPNEILEKQRSGLWLDVDLGDAPDSAHDEQAPHVFLEQFRLIDLDDDGYAEPYIVTVHQETQKVVRLVARFSEQGILRGSDGSIVRVSPDPYFTKYGFIPNPDGSFYDIGFGTLLGPLGETINSTINQLMDAGHLANLQSGFIGAGIGLKSGSQSFRPGEWKKVDVQGSTVAQNVVPLPSKEPSSVLFSLMQFLIEAGKDVTATQDIMTGDTGRANQPVGTTLAIIEQGLKTFTAIVKRIHRALKDELKILYRLNSLYLDPEVYFEFQDSPQAVAQQDYALGDIDVQPVSDPSMATDMQKMGRAQFLMSLRGQGLNDMEINKRVLEAASIPDAKTLLPDPNTPPPIPPEVQVQMKEMELRGRELDLKEREVAAKEMTAQSGAAVDAANAQKTMLETMLAAPAFQAQVAQLVDARAHQIVAGMMNGPQVRPADVHGMAGPPADPGVPPLPPGPAPVADVPMGGGPGDGLAPPDQGPPAGGSFGPGMG